MNSLPARLRWMAKARWSAIGRTRAWVTRMPIRAWARSATSWASRTTSSGVSLRKAVSRSRELMASGTNRSTTASGSTRSPGRLP